MWPRTVICFRLASHQNHTWITSFGEWSFLLESLPLPSLAACPVTVFAVKKFFLMFISNGEWNHRGSWLSYCLRISKLSWRFRAGARFLLFFRSQGILGPVRPESLRCGLICIWKVWRETECSTMVPSQLSTCPSRSLHSLLRRAALPSPTALSEAAPPYCLPVSLIYPKKKKRKKKHRSLPDIASHIIYLFIAFLIHKKSGALVYASGSLTRMCIRISPRAC